MKKIIALLLVVIMSISIIACGQAVGNSLSENTVPETKEEDSEIASETDKEEKETYNIAYFAMSQDDLWKYLEDEYRRGFETLGITMETFNADFDPIRQVEQIENAIIKGGYDLFWVLSIDPDATADACKKARENGIPVMAFIKDVGEDSCDSFRGSDEKLIAKGIIEYASEWANETFAGDGSCNVIVIGGISPGSETERFDALCEYIKDEPIFNVLEEVQVEMEQTKGMSTTENMFSKYSDINCIIYASVDHANGGIAYIESESSPLKDFSEFGVFCGSVSQETADDMRRVADGKGVVRGIINTGGGYYDMSIEVGEQMIKMMTGQSYERDFPVPAVRVTPDNLSEFGY
ncbi:MAG: sugar ABC transporter substrate-binding protein [Lachnospiraceae bacterium]|nr:sugar ABC transporter substrate-binding protein [Lachnospiraceae bacterium]